MAFATVMKDTGNQPADLGKHAATAYLLFTCRTRWSRVELPECVEISLKFIGFVAAFLGDAFFHKWQLTCTSLSNVLTWCEKQILTLEGATEQPPCGSTFASFLPGRLWEP